MINKIKINRMRNIINKVKSIFKKKPILEEKPVAPEVRGPLYAYRTNK